MSRKRYVVKFLAGQYKLWVDMLLIIIYVVLNEFNCCFRLG